MDRRNIFRGLFAAAAGVTAVSAAKAATSGNPDAARVAYHVDEFERVGFALGNIGNHYEGMGGPAHVRIDLVILGPAMKAVVAASADEKLAKRLAGMQQNGLELWACVNTLRGMKLTIDDLLPGFKLADKGGVVKLAELQSQGWCYLRP